VAKKHLPFSGFCAIPYGTPGRFLQKSRLRSGMLVRTVRCRRRWSQLKTRKAWAAFFGWSMRQQWVLMQRSAARSKTVGGPSARIELASELPVITALHHAIAIIQHETGI
jgi:hypothetical protein